MADADRWATVRRDADWFEAPVPLSTIVAIQFVPLLAICAVIATFTWRRTGSSLPGALICGLFVTWYVVAGTATQAAF